MRSLPVVVEGTFDDLRSPQIRLLEEASRLGPLTVLLHSDERIGRETGRAPKFPERERQYFLQSLRYVAEVRLLAQPVGPGDLVTMGFSRPGVWVAGSGSAEPARTTMASGWTFQAMPEPDSREYPEPPPMPDTGGAPRPRVVVTGCYDWFHSGHVRFFEEASAFGDLYVVVGNDANLRLLKGPGHPLFPEGERRYLVGSVRFVKQALISSGEGWLDADPEIQQIQPRFYVVNEDGDKGGKREYCRERGIEYKVLRRLPAPGLPGRSSTNLRGF